MFRSKILDHLENCLDFFQKAWNAFPIQLYCEAESKENQGVWDPMPELTIT